MKSQLEMLRSIQEIKNQTGEYLAKQPQDERFSWVLKELDRMTGLVENLWPLLAEDKVTISLGLYAARNLEELDGGRFATLLHHLAGDLERS